ncbi:MAG: T9SS type A sorting domain-containing protein [Candidatus Methylacidiphilales bacterium]
MKQLFTFLIFSVFLNLSCGPSAEEMAAMERCIQEEINVEIALRENLISTFDVPFPKRNKNLAKILGDTLQLEGRCFPLTFKILSNRKSNLIININTGDTLFKGTVCKYRDLYYFSEQLNDTSFRIFALKITDSLIYGFQNYFQYVQIDSLVAQGKFPQVVKHIDKDKKVIRLHPDKKELRKLFTPILANTKPFEIIGAKSNIKANDLDEVSAPIETDDLEVIAKVYPNPAVDELNIELHQKNTATEFYLSDLNAKVMLKGELSEIVNKINISHLPNGIYTLTVLSSSKQTETVKIIKGR